MGGSSPVNSQDRHGSARVSKPAEVKVKSPLEKLRSRFEPDVLNHCFLIPQPNATHLLHTLVDDVTLNGAASIVLMDKFPRGIEEIKEKLKEWRDLGRTDKRLKEVYEKSEEASKAGK
jgi:hypothetical protein